MPITDASADAVVVAAGSSTRMGGVDKVWADVGGRPLLALSVAAIAAAPEVRRIVVVVAPERVEDVARSEWAPSKLAAIVAGGSRRQESVAAGVHALAALDPEGDENTVVLIHDGARPLVSPELVARVAVAARDHGAAIPVLPIAETVKRLDRGVIAETVDRSTLATAQTPQGVRRSLLLSAYARYPPSDEREFTDEAALLEACKIPVHAIPGDPSNLKVTLPADLARIDPTTPTARVGFGDDSHPFGPGAPLALGGIEIEGAPRLNGHSDGDVVLHAVADALLGAAALGDLGRLFPAGPETPRGIASTELLRTVVDRLRDRGLRPASIDVVLVAARPRLGQTLDRMRDAVAAIVGVAPDRVSIKASTGNLAGPEGAGRGIAARAIALVEPAP
ncbi:MAG: 2-C-methyl-D-erythritol 4-phosphate cytidylyltransferase [Chloroflexota bacterium]